MHKIVISLGKPDKNGTVPFKASISFPTETKPLCGWGCDIPGAVNSALAFAEACGYSASRSDYELEYPNSKALACVVALKKLSDIHGCKPDRFASGARERVRIDGNFAVVITDLEDPTTVYIFDVMLGKGSVSCDQISGSAYQPV